jgi:hypothetical protein
MVARRLLEMDAVMPGGVATAITSCDSSSDCSRAVPARQGFGRSATSL